MQFIFLKKIHKHAVSNARICELLVVLGFSEEEGTITTFAKKGGTLYVFFSLKTVAIMFQISVFLIVAKILAAFKNICLIQFLLF